MNIFSTSAFSCRLFRKADRRFSWALSVNRSHENFNLANPGLCGVHAKYYPRIMRYRNVCYMRSMKRCTNMFRRYEHLNLPKRTNWNTKRTRFIAEITPMEAICSRWKIRPFDSCDVAFVIEKFNLSQNLRPRVIILKTFSVNICGNDFIAMLGNGTVGCLFLFEVDGSLENRYRYVFETILDEIVYFVIEIGHTSYYVRN